MTDAELLRELNADVWHPFRAAHAAGDTDGYLALHTPEVIRAGGPRKVVQSYEEMAAETRPWFADAVAQGLRLGIDFRFVERLAAGGLACERGLYRIEAGDAVFHGRFHTFSRRTGAGWRITADYDVPEPDATRLPRRPPHRRPDPVHDLTLHRHGGPGLCGGPGTAARPRTWTVPGAGPRWFWKRNGPGPLAGAGTVVVRQAIRPGGRSPPGGPSGPG